MSNTLDIVILDDDDAILDAVALALEDSGFKVKTFSDVKKLNKLLKTYTPKVILLDILMAGVDGRKICVLLKSQQKTKKIPVIMMSAQMEMERESISCGAEDFIAKPFELEQLITKVKKYC
jgi:DNA-binding response OmpR family regulator